MNRLVKVLMDRDGMSQPDVEQWINDVANEYNNDPDSYDMEEMMLEEFGIEPDYLFDFLEFVRI